MYTLFYIVLLVYIIIHDEHHCLPVGTEGTGI